MENQTPPAPIPTPPTQPKRQLGHAKIVIGAALILFQLTREDFGFINVGGPQGTGFNAGTAAMYIIGIGLIYAGFRRRAGTS